MGELHSERTQKEFCRFIAARINCNVSLASVERIFLTCGFVLSKLRNSLGIIKAQNLVKIHQFLRKKEKKSQVFEMLFVCVFKLNIKTVDT